MEKRKHKGQGLVEFALILPVMLLIIIGIIEFARIFLIYASVSNAAREGTRYGMVSPRDYAGIRQRVIDKMSMTSPANLTLAVKYDTGPDGQEYTDPTRIAVGHRVVVEVQYHVEPLTLFFEPFIPDDFTIDIRNARTIQSIKLTISPTVFSPPGSVTPTQETTITPTPAETATDIPVATETPTPSGPTPTPTDTPTPTATPVTPIIITKPVWAGATVVQGTAAPNQVVTLRIVQTGYQLSGVVNGSGQFNFSNLPPLVGGHTIIVQGYGSQDLAVVQFPTSTPTHTPTPPPTPSSPYISIAPVCSNEAYATIQVTWGNWSSAAKTMYIYWGSDLTNAVCSGAIGEGTTGCSFTTFVAEGSTNTVTGIAKKSNGSEVGRDTKTFTRPCTGTPSPTPTPLPQSDLQIIGISVQDIPPLGTYQTLHLTVGVRNVGTADVASLFWVDLYADPTGVLTSQASIDYVAVNALAAGSAISFTMYVPEGFKTTGLHTVQAMVDTWNQIRETNELNNISVLLPVTITVNNPAPTLTPTPEGTLPPPGNIQGMTYLDGLPQNNVTVYVFAADGRLVGSGRSNAYGVYTISNIPAGQYTVVGELRLANMLYRGQVSPVYVVGGQTTIGINIELVEVP